jgi:hypothetical protein
MLFAKCLRVQDYGTAARILKDSAELCGLYPARPVAPNGKQPDGRMGIFMALIPQLKAAMESLAPGTGGETLAIAAVGDAETILQHRPGDVQGTLDNSSGERNRDVR